MKLVAALLATLLAAPAAFADSTDRTDRVGDKLIVGGAATFTVAYVPMSITGLVFGAGAGNPAVGGSSFLPVGGPIFLGSLFVLEGNAPPINQAFATLAIIDGVVQLGGIALMIAGSVHRHRVAAQATRSLSLR